MPDLHRVVGENIKLIRIVKGLTQEAMAEKAGISSSYLGYLERGKKSPSLELLARIAAALEVKPGELLTMSDQETNLELRKLNALLSGKGLEPVRFISEVATAYFESLNRLKH